MKTFLNKKTNLWYSHFSDTNKTLWLKDGKRRVDLKSLSKQSRDRKQEVHTRPRKNFLGDNIEPGFEKDKGMN